MPREDLYFRERGGVWTECSHSTIFRGRKDEVEPGKESE